MPLFDGKRSILDPLPDDKSQHSEQPASPQNTSSKEHKETAGQAPNALVVPELPPSLPQQVKPENRANETPTWKKYLEYAAVITGIGLLIVNIGLWCATRNTMKIDQRAWLFENFLPGELFPGQSVRQKLELGNSGKTPLLNCTGMVVSFWVPNDWVPTFTYLHGTHINSPPILANHPLTAFSQLIPQNVPKGDRPVPVILTSDMLTQLNMGLANIITYGRLEYDDHFGTHHWSTFCGADTMKAENAKWWGACVAYNDIDRN